MKIFIFLKNEFTFRARVKILLGLSDFIKNTIVSQFINYLFNLLKLYFL